MLTFETVQRDEHGEWTHPALLALFGSRETIQPDEWESWLTSHNIEIASSSMEHDLPDDHPAWIRHFEDGHPGCVGWNPEPPAGEGWMILSIHDTEDGPIAIWYRQLARLAGQ